MSEEGSLAIGEAEAARCRQADDVCAIVVTVGYKGDPFVPG
jgi:hypothetical protein